MIPERGDKSVTVSAGDVAAGLADAGVESGDTVLFHSSLSSMGRVYGGPNAVIEGVIQAVGPEGTVVRRGVREMAQPGPAAILLWT